ncbi:MAG TPA: rhomboid family intramembrane serine protease [Candidatus Acidoferrales bacterium]|nr:rhomboid family intramembrane serine protease [Candidatus Acidoferrales bacterium]
MGGLIPLTDASRRPIHFPAVTTGIIVANFLVWALELAGGDAFVLKWSAIPAQITSGHHWITILTAMFMHGSWSHILGNMIFLWAFGPEIEDSMSRLRYLAFYLLGGIIAMLAQVLASPSSTVPNLGASGAIAAVMGAFLVTYPRDKIKVLLFILFFVRVTVIPAALLIGVWFLIQLFNVGSIASTQTGGVAYLAHVGGALFGAIAARFFEDPVRVEMRNA